MKIENIEDIIARAKNILFCVFRKHAYETTEATNRNPNNVVSIPITEWNAKYGVNAKGNAAIKYNLNLFSVKIFSEYPTKNIIPILEIIVTVLLNIIGSNPSFIPIATIIV